MRTSENKDKLIDLYNRIPDYSQVKHLGNSEFINTLEKLKEEFRQCRAGLHELDSDVEYITQQTSKVLNISKADQSSAARITTKNVNITKKTTNNFSASHSPTRLDYPYRSKEDNNSQPKSSYLSIRSCALHNPNELIPYNSTNLRQYEYPKYERDDDYAEDFELCSDGLSTPESGLSKWSSSPELYRTRSREVSPPAHVERRLLLRRAQNSSAPSLPDKDDEKPQMFRANPVPEHVHKPLFDYIMLKNKRRSMRVRERSKQRLMSQMKPFSFPHDSKNKPTATHGSAVMRSSEVLNNARPTKKKKQCLNSEFKNKFDHHTFRAHPAPPRSRALLSAIKLKEQQEYRELRKKLRAEALMKSSSLPPSMAARDRINRHHCLRLEDLLARYNSKSGKKSVGRSRGSSIFSFSDEEFSDDDFVLGRRSRPGTSKVASKKSRNFTPYGEPRFPPHSSATDRIFETTSNDNHASRLRVQVAKAKEEERLKREEEELMRQMKIDKKRQHLRDSHALAWRIARSYSSSQDIAMRRQLRMATAILERESYKKDMNSMLSRVRSAPLLLEGVRERKCEPCKKHKDELTSGRKSPTKFNSAGHNIREYRREVSRWGLRNEEGEKSETAAMAEGSLTLSDNESVKNLDLDDDEAQKPRGTSNGQLLPKQNNIRTDSPQNQREESKSPSQHDHEDEEIADECDDDFEDEISEHCE